MFWHLFKYRMIVLIQNKSLLFWTLAFPILLGAMFMAAFGSIDSEGKIETLTVGIVSEDISKATTFTDVLDALENDGQPLFQIKAIGKEDAKEQLMKDKIAGYYTVNQQTITLTVAQTGIGQTIMKNVMDKYLQTSSMAEMLASGNVDYTKINQLLNEQLNFIQEKEHRGNLSLKSFYFFTLIGMSILYGFIWGLRNAQDQQANQSANGIRLSLIPANKLVVSIANTLAGFLLFFSEVLIQLAVFHFIYQVDFGDRWGFILLVAAWGSLNALLLGTIAGNILSKMSLPQKEGIGMGVTMFMSFLAGMMGSQEIKHWVDVYLPLLGRINLVNIVSESLYQLFFYQSLKPFYTNLIWLGGFTILFIALNYLYERRIQYDNL